jgi:hypothetical protein
MLLQWTGSVHHVNGVSGLVISLRARWRAYYISTAYLLDKSHNRAWYLLASMQIEWTRIH